MKTAFLIFAGLFLAVSPAGATGKETAQFLKKLNGYYYCLSRDGLQNYSFEMDCALEEKSKKELLARGAFDKKLWAAVQGLHLRLEDGVDRPLEVEGSGVLKTGKPALDARIEKLDEDILQALKAFFQFWKGITLEPLNDPRDIDQGTLKYQKGAQGFKILQG